MGQFDDIFKKMDEPQRPVSPKTVLPNINEIVQQFTKQEKWLVTKEEAEKAIDTYFRPKTEHILSKNLPINSWSRMEKRDEASALYKKLSLKEYQYGKESDKNNFLEKYSYLKNKGYFVY